MIVNNRESANKYYTLINELIDNYVEKWKIKPSNLKKYLKPGTDRFKKFIERNNLTEVVGIDRIIKDVIDDRYHMEKDGVLTFENFKLFESDEFKIKDIKQSLYKGIEKADINMEKIIADNYDTNLSDIDIINSDKHIFKVKEWKNITTFVIIYSDEEFNVIKNNITEFLYNTLITKDIEIYNDISIKLDTLISQDKYNEKIKEILTDDKIKNIISSMLGNYKYLKDINNYHLWEFSDNH